jgi:hypothetical protein
MAIVGWPDDVPIQKTSLCIVCNEEKPTEELTVGLCNAFGQQAFACNKHFSSSSQFITGWADFKVRQQQLLAKAKIGEIV